MRLSEYGFKPATLACLHNADIDAPWELDDHTCRELIWHSEITPEALYDVLCALRRHGMTLKPNTKGIERPVSERNLEVFRLRVVEGHKLREVAERNDIGVERVRQILSTYFGLRGEPPVIKARRNRRRGGETK